MAKTCTVCGSEWIFKAPKGIHHLCAECYTEMNTAVSKYHDMQTGAHQQVMQGRIVTAINLLHLVQAERNHIQKYFSNTLNAGHYWFANEFIPTLIDNLSRKNINPVAIWDLAFASL